MDRQRFLQILGTVALALLLVGAILYAVNSPQRSLTLGLLGAGTGLLLIYGAGNVRRIVEFARRRSARYGANLVVMVLLFSSVVIIVQAISARHSYRYDTTANKRFSLSSQTLGVLGSLNRDVMAYGFYAQGSVNRAFAEDLMNQYAHESSQFRFEIIDPDRHPARATDMGVEDYGTVVLRTGERREAIASLTEEKLTNALVKLTRSDVKTIYFVTGHGEKEVNGRGSGGGSIMKEAIEDENYRVLSLSLFDAERVPDDCAVLIVAGPKRDYFDSEIVKIQEYADPGGNLIIMVDARVDVPNIESLLAQYRAGLHNDVIIDPYSRVFGGEYTVPVVTEYAGHPITRDLEGLASIFPMARSVLILDEPLQGTSAQYLASTGTSAWGEVDLEGVGRGQAVREDNDTPSPLPLAMIASKKAVRPAPSNEPPGESRLVLFGDSDFVDNSTFRIGGNADLFLNSVNFLAEEKDMIAIRARKGMGDRLFLTASQGRLVFLLCVVVLPAAVLGVGGTVFFRRRNSG